MYLDPSQTGLQRRRWRSFCFRVNKISPASLCKRSACSYIDALTKSIFCLFGYLAQVITRGSCRISIIILMNVIKINILYQSAF